MPVLCGIFTEMYQKGIEPGYVNIEVLLARCGDVAVEPSTIVELIDL